MTNKLPEGWEWNFDEDAVYGPCGSVQRYWPSRQADWRCYVYPDPNRSLRVLSDQLFTDPLTAISALEKYPLEVKERGEG